jgi:type VI protein secretion system component VasF
MIEPEETHFLPSPAPPSPVAPSVPPWMLAVHFLLALCLTFLLVRISRQDHTLALL